MILALAGGVGGAKLAHGLAQALAPEDLTIVVNTGDDFRHLGLHVSPDLDTMMYTLANMNDPQRGWGVANESWNFMENLGKLGGETWFQLGDRDLATNVARTHRLQQGQALSEITAVLCRQLGVRHKITPMSDDPVRTVVHTDEGILEFQNYFVRRRAEPVLTRIEYTGAVNARMAPAMQAALNDPTLDVLVICPSNPYLSIAPILTVPGVRSAIENRRIPAIAVSPIVGGQALKGPTAKIMRELGKQSSVVEIARYYSGLIDALVIDDVDSHLRDEIRRTGAIPLVTKTVMRDTHARRELALDILQCAEQLRADAAHKARA